MEIDQTKKQDQSSNGVDDDQDKWVQDSSFDHRGRIPLRSSTGAWKASFFIIGIDFGERLSYFGLASSLIIYLTKVMHQYLKTAAKNAHDWIGVTAMVTPLLGGFLADAYLGRFYTVLVTSAVYIMGLLLLTMSQGVPSLKPCGDDMNCQESRRIHKIFFFLAMYLISIGTGHRPALESFGADQFDDDHPQEKIKKMSFFNWWNVGLCGGLLLGVTVIVYIQDHVSWAAADITLTTVTILVILVFCLGRRFYRYRKASGSPLTPLLQVFAAAIAKRSLPYPSVPDQLYEGPMTDKARGRLLSRTDKLMFLDKAAIIEDGQNSAEKRNPWRLATVTQVEEAKLIVNMIPIWLTVIPFGICIAQGSTFFIKQSATLDRRFTNNFTLPASAVLSLTAIGMMVSITIYDRVLEPSMRRLTGKTRGISILQRIGIGMIFSIATMVTAALVERKRLYAAEKSPSKGGSVSMSVLWLAPQFVVIGIGDGFALVGLQEYFYDQAPDSMRSLGIAFYLSVIGASHFICNVLITIVDGITGKMGKSWFGKDLNSSRVDYFYWLLAAITAGNLCIYVFIARRYSYKSVRTTGNKDVAHC